MRIAFLGGYGHHYLRLLRDDPTIAQNNLEFAGCSDGQDLGASKLAAERWNIPRFFDDPAVMFEQFKPDILNVGAMFAHNGDWVLEGLRRGIPVVSDKPIATTWEQYHAIAAHVEQAGGIVLTEFDFRATSVFRAAQEAIASGKIGRVVLASAQKSYRFGQRPAWYADRAKYGGTLLWIASHAIDALQWVSGLRLARVIGHGGNLSRPTFGSMEDHLALLYEYAGGATGVVHADFLRPDAAPTHGDDRLRVAGSEGIVEVRDGRCWLMTRSQAPVDLTPAQPIRSLGAELLAGIRGESSYFSSAQSLDAARLLLQSREATDERRWVELA